LLRSACEPAPVRRCASRRAARRCVRQRRARGAVAARRRAHPRAVRRARTGGRRCARHRRRHDGRDRARRDVARASRARRSRPRRGHARRADRLAGYAVHRGGNGESRRTRNGGRPAMSVVAMLFFIVVLLFALLAAAALLTWVERRLLAWWQDRYGPNRAGPFGILQAFADVIKILLKEDWIPPLADKPVFVIAPAIVAITMLLGFAIVPFAPGLAIADLNVALLFFFAMTGLSVYSVTFAGWAANNNYSL